MIPNARVLWFASKETQESLCQDALVAHQTHLLQTIAYTQIPIQ